MEGIYGKTMNVITTKQSAKEGSDHSNRQSSTKSLTTGSAGGRDATHFKLDKGFTEAQSLEKETVSSRNGQKYYGSPIQPINQNTNKLKSGGKAHEGNPPVHKRNDSFIQRFGKKKCEVSGEGTKTKQNAGNIKAEASEQIDAFKSDTFDPFHTRVPPRKEGDQEKGETCGDSKSNVTMESNTKKDDSFKPVKVDKIKKNIRLYQSAKMQMKKLVTHKNSKVRVLDEDVEKSTSNAGERDHRNKFSKNPTSHLTETSSESVIQENKPDVDKTGRCKITIKAQSSANCAGKSGGEMQGDPSTSLARCSNRNLNEDSRMKRIDKPNETVGSIGENLFQNIKENSEVARRVISKREQHVSNAPNSKLHPAEVIGGAVVEDVDTSDTSPASPAVISTKSEALKTSEQLKAKTVVNARASPTNMGHENITNAKKTPFLLDKPKLAWSSPPSQLHNMYDERGGNEKNPMPESISSECENGLETEHEELDQTSPFQVTSLHSFNEEADALDLMLKGFTHDVKDLLNHGDDGRFSCLENTRKENREIFSDDSKKINLKEDKDKYLPKESITTLPGEENKMPNSTSASVHEKEIQSGVKNLHHIKTAERQAKTDLDLKTLQPKTVEECWKAFVQNEISKSSSGECGDNLQKHNPLSWALATQSANNLNNPERPGVSAKVVDGDELQKKEKGPSKLQKLKQIFTPSYAHNSWVPARHNFKPRKFKPAAEDEAKTKEKGHRVTPNTPGTNEPPGRDAVKTDEGDTGNTVTVRNVSTLTKTASVKSNRNLMEMFSASKPTSTNVT